jgi:outer membrane protein OmpA-like peptidoglycan-associated protein
MLKHSALALWVVFAGCVTPRASGVEAAKRDVSQLVTLETDSIVVKEAISFPHGKSELEPTSLDLLDAIVEIMTSTSAITMLSIEGHTDSTGDPELNLPLSEARAAAVKSYLESKGVAPGRLTSKGFGSTQPLDSNDTEEGRAKNRRVEFKVSR